MAYAWGDSRRREVARGSGDSVGRGGFQELIQSQLVDAYLLQLHAGLASVNRNCLRSTEHRSVLTICDVSDNMRPDSMRSGLAGAALTPQSPRRLRVLRSLLSESLLWSEEHSSAFGTNVLYSRIHSLIA